MDYKISVLIPAYNEERGIKKTINSCLNQTRKPDEIIVVNDGSTDNTSSILKSYGDKIKTINLKKNTGNKSKAQEIGLKYITGDIFITTDADTRLDGKFIQNAIKHFKTKSVSAVCGYVQSEKGNWITRVREINYVIGQTIYKKAQADINALFVLAGCASAFRTKDFKEVITFEHDNITEDLDFTYKLKLANKKIVYETSAVVYTQDPNNLKSYCRQLNRWYSGGWTCLRKNKSIIKKPNNALILFFIYLEGLVGGLLFILSPLLILFDWKFFLLFVGIQFLMVSGTLMYGAIKRKELHLFKYIPHHYLLNIADNYIFIKTFFKEIIFKKKNKNLVWDKPKRY
jgi:cellulose synthase/poly-beta-1,6-N-acetylglucosamine synthase-like glycosyltransferase